MAKEFTTIAVDKDTQQLFKFISAMSNEPIYAIARRLAIKEKERLDRAKNR
tara:strand:+ start:449 stop:601 length:153 start_codon:yes stop_codon:yes gene_type:complete